MDDRWTANEFGREVAAGMIVNTVSVEACLACSPTIYPYPVELEPVFTPFDHLQTFQARTESMGAVPVRGKQQRWVVRRILLPVLDRLDLRRTESVIASLAACKGMMSFELQAHRDGAEFYVGASQGLIDTVSDAWM